MRQFFVTLPLLLLTAGTGQAQPEKKLPKFTAKITNVRVGFRGTNPNELGGQFKLGLWTPVFVDVLAGQKGLKRPGITSSYIEVESADIEGVGSIYRIPVDDMDALETRTFIAYAKPGNAFGSEDVKVTLRVDRESFSGPEQPGRGAAQLNTHLYLSLGARLPTLREAIGRLNAGQQNPDFGINDIPNRQAAFESDVARLPDLWFGYQGVDLVFLSTDRKEFLTALTNDKRNRLKALAQWVRRGGKLVIPVHHDTQPFLEKLLQDQAWEPPVPVIPPGNPGDVQASASDRLREIEVWIGGGVKPFRAAKPIALAKLEPGKIAPGYWEVLVATDKERRPLVTRMPYGLGNITLIAFSLDSGPFTEWEDRAEFLKTLIRKAKLNPIAQDGMGRGNDFGNPDLASNLQRELEKVDVDVVPFGFVALFIILYIIVVGPLDYVILKYVFKKLEWTWITFPSVVIGVSVAAYFTAYAIKGDDLKVNRVDLIDFDLRTDLDGKLKTRRAYAYGQSFIMLFSPRIQNYTVGVEPNPAFWGEKPAKTPMSADVVSWFGRPEFQGPGSMGGGSQGFFRRPYSYADDATGLEGVPIPVWTTRTFSASWEAALPAIPFEADLLFHTRDVGGQDLKLSGTFKNNLPVDLEDVYLIYGDRAFRIDNGLPAAKGVAEAKSVKLTPHSSIDLSAFLNASDVAGRIAGIRGGRSQCDPTALIKQAMFFERSNQRKSERNHALRPLDLSWRMKAAWPMDADAPDMVREAILYARIRYQSGPGEMVTAAAMAPTNLWLGALPGQTDRAGQVVARPKLDGTMGQDTYVRILLPVRAGD